MVDAAGAPGSFIEIFVDTPHDEVMRRDVKGWYAGAQRGEVKQMTGLDDPYEQPLTPDLRLLTMDRTVDQNVAAIMAFLEERELL
jgi:bifunctional enzyme CysN/CysC